jgi:protein O-GlcNAc transferase
LEHLDTRAVETVCYSDRRREDDMTSRLQAAATTWHDVRLLSDEKLADQIRADQIDILFDLAGHTSGNRLLVFARKPAPIQISWMGYVGTTGLDAMDYLLADRRQVPASAEPYLSERVLCMPDGYVCYAPPDDAPPVSPLPAQELGYVTFGSFNHPAKVTAEVVAVWARILRRVVGSRLILKYAGLNSPAARQRIEHLFAMAGVDAKRFTLLGWSDQTDLLRHYQQVDVALDPFPYGGGMTTCEALWMGVPVVTCPGQTFASRHALSPLTNVGLTETIARDWIDYEEIALRLAGDLPRLADVRADLRRRMAASPLCDAPRFAQNFANVLRGAWREWCLKASA